MALTASLIAVVAVMLFAPFTLFAKNVHLPLESLVTGPFNWAMNNSSTLWTNLTNNLSKL
jgi:hypothetical protein